MTVPCSIVKGEKLFLDISSPSTAYIGGKRHCLLIVEDSRDQMWSYFSKKKSELKDVMMSPLKDLKAMYCVTLRYVHCGNDGENEAFANRKGWV